MVMCRRSKHPGNSELFLVLDRVNTGGGFIEEVGKGPGKQDGEFVAKADEEGEVNEEPRQPGREALEL